MNGEANKMRTDLLTNRDICQQCVVQGIKDLVDKQTGWYSHVSWMSPYRNALVSGENSSRGRKEFFENRTKYNEIYAGEMILLTQNSVIVYCLLCLISSYVKMQDEVLRTFFYFVARIRCFDWSLGWRICYLVDTFSRSEKN